MNETVREMQAASCRYRDACAAVAARPGTALLVYERGHGTALMAMQAGMRAGAKTMLFVVPKPMQQAWAEQLGRHGYAPVLVDPHKGSMSNACRQASNYKDAAPAAYIAAPNQMAEAGHWHEAWRDRTAFQFVAALDGGSFQNLKSEKSRGLKSVMDRAGNAVLLVDRDEAMLQAPVLAQNWNLEISPVMPQAAPLAASACEAAGMDA